ncbi:MAG: hypothetical protein SNJ77_11370, partial [Cytophagales bacterium]
VEEIQNKWFLYDFRLVVDYGVIGLSTRADLQFKNAIDSSSICEKSETYQFNDSGLFNSFQDFECQEDTIKGAWKLDLSEKTLIIQNNFFRPPYASLVLVNLPNPSLPDTVSIFQNNYIIEKGNRYEMVLRQEFQGILDQERWDNDRERFEMLLGDIRSVLPIIIQTKSYYTLRPKF